jgi:hypothetical protein
MQHEKPCIAVRGGHNENKYQSIDLIDIGFGALAACRKNPQNKLNDSLADYHFFY